jgi:hypothetical protein
MWVAEHSEGKQVLDHVTAADIEAAGIGQIRCPINHGDDCGGVASTRHHQSKARCVPMGISKAMPIYKKRRKNTPPTR